MSGETPFRDMSLIDHLRDLRKMIVHSLVAVFIAAAAAFLAKSIIFDKILFAPLHLDFVTYRMFCRISDALCVQKIPITLIARKLQGQFSVHIWTSVYAGIILAFPYILYELWKFVAPGLYPSEQRYGKRFVFVTSILFFIGILFGYYIITPLVINFLGNYTISDRVENMVDITSYISSVRTTILANGLVFELPVIIYFFVKLGLVDSGFLKQSRKYAYVLILILAAIITPPDIFSQVVVAIPLVVLYEVSIFVARWLERGKSGSQALQKTDS